MGVKMLVTFLLLFLVAKICIKYDTILLLYNSPLGTITLVNYLKHCHGQLVWID